MNCVSTQIIAERKRYHERTNDRYLQNFDNDVSAENDDTSTVPKNSKYILMGSYSTYLIFIPINYIFQLFPILYDL